MFLLGFIDSSHAAFADERKNPILANCRGAGPCPAGIFRYALEGSFLGYILAQEGLDFAPQFLVALASFSEKRAALDGRLVARLVVELPYSLPTLGLHGRYSTRMALQVLRY
jgi:hypothetical protein